MTGRRRVVVTGMGVISPAGFGVAPLMAALNAGTVFAAPHALLEEYAAPVTLACAVPDPDLSDFLTLRETRQVDRAGAFALAAALAAVRDAGIGADALATERAGVSVGIGAGGLLSAERLVRDHHDDLDGLPAFTVPSVMANSAAARIGVKLGVHGPALTFAMACASAAMAIGEAYGRIRRGEWDVAITGGTEAAISPAIVAAFARTGAMTFAADPAIASRPFDAARDGFVMGEGAAFVVLEEAEYARARGARVLAEVGGFAANSDAHHIVAPRPDGRLAAACMRAALADAGVDPGEVGHVNAHGTSTALNDRSEAIALGEVFADASPPVIAPKGSLGHSLGASGALELVVSVEAARTRWAPPIAGTVAGDDVTASLDLVVQRPRALQTGVAISNSFAFGGHNAALVIAADAS